MSWTPLGRGPRLASYLGAGIQHRVRMTLPRSHLGVRLGPAWLSGSTWRRPAGPAHLVYRITETQARPRRRGGEHQRKYRVDRARTARPCSLRERDGGPGTPHPATRLSGKAHTMGSSVACPVGRARRKMGALIETLFEGQFTMAARYSGSRHARDLFTRHSCPSRASPTEGIPDRRAVGCITRTRCRFPVEISSRMKTLPRRRPGKDVSPRSRTLGHDTHIRGRAEALRAC